MVKKKAAVVILYHADKFIEKHIKSYINFVEKLYIIDNSETKGFNTQVLSFYSNKIVFIQDGINQGIAMRLNQACKLAIKDGFTFLLTMDQDSYFNKYAIEKYFKCVDLFEDKVNIAMFGINYNTQTTTNCAYKKNKILITSGSVINLLAYEQIGDFDENLFIDLVDTEYCFRSLQKDYNTIEFSNIFMYHQIGEVALHRSFKNLKSSMRSIHSSDRLYYITRNFLYLKKKYNSKFKEELSVYKKDLIVRIKNKLLYQKNRYRTLKHLFKAFNDYKNNKMGKQL